MALKKRGGKSGISAGICGKKKRKRKRSEGRRRGGLRAKNGPVRRNGNFFAGNASVDYERYNHGNMVAQKRN